MSLIEFTGKLQRGHSLATEEVQESVQALIDPSHSPERKADFLIALAQKGESIEEISAFAMALREHSVKVPLSAELRAQEILDVCGTGGDRLNTFNISTTTALVVAAAGVSVAKHGNRAITSQSGSADVLENLGIPIELTPEAAATSLAQHQFAFFFAPLYHPTFKFIGPARKLCAERGQRTIFNFLGPLLNPARPTAQLVGVPHKDLTGKLARVLQSLGIRRAMVVSGEVDDRWIDEFSILGKTHLAEFYQDRGFASSIFDPTDFPIQPARLPDLAGAAGAEGALVVERILQGKDGGPRRDAVLLNAAAALMVAGKVRTMIEGWELAAEILQSGKGWEKVLHLRAGRGQLT